MIKNITCISITGGDRFKTLAQIGYLYYSGVHHCRFLQGRNSQTADLVLGFAINVDSILRTSSESQSISWSMQSHYYHNKSQQITIELTAHAHLNAVLV